MLEKMRRWLGGFVWNKSGRNEGERENEKM